MSPAKISPEESNDTLVLNSRDIRTDWIFVAARCLTAAVLLSLLGVPHVPLVVLYLYVHEQVTTWLRGRLAAGETSYKAAYLVTIFMMVVFWTGLACWLWKTAGILGQSSATGILFSAAYLGAVRGYGDRSFLLATCTPPFVAMLALTLGELDDLQDPRLIIAAIAPLVLGSIAVGRSVSGLRQRDLMIRQTDLEKGKLLATIREAHSRLEQVTVLSGVAGWDVELPSRSCTLSPGAMKLLGLDDPPASLETLILNFTPESGSAFLVALRDARRHGRPVDVDAQMLSTGSEVRWIRLVGTVINDERGDSRFIGAMQDLSERIAGLGRERREEVASALSRLSSKTASEFKKDLNEISRSLAELGRRAESGTLEHALMQGMRLSLNRALDTAQSLQAFAANNPIEPGIVDVNKCVSDVVSAASRLLPTGIKLALNTDRNSLPALLDAAEFELSVLHLILNARDAMEAGGELTITTGVDVDGWAFVCVSDTGAGIRPGVQARIFEPFYTTKRASGARGLGLSIVRGFVEQARGKLEVKSIPGSGTTFRIAFPPAVRKERMAEGSAASTPEIRGTVLIAHEDDRVLQHLGPALLAEGLILHYARTAKDGLSMLESKVRYDCVLLSEAQSRSLRGQALAVRLPRQWPNVRIAVLADPDSAPPTLSDVAHLVLPTAEPAPSIAQRLADLIRDHALTSTRQA